MGPNFMIFLPWCYHHCLKADPLLQRHLTAEPSNQMLMSLSHYYTAKPRVGYKCKYHYYYNGARAGRSMTIN
jgi:hypothetical protein